MVTAIILILIVVGAVVFTFLSPWWFSPLASNWGQIDTTIMITFVVTGVVFILVNLFIAWTIIRYRYKKDRRAAYEPDNKKLEWWLIGITTVGVVILLAPGLFVYSDFVSPPAEAMTVEALGQQWQWSFRLPGEDGVLGTTNPKLISNSDPFGLDPEDPHGQDDVLVFGNELHLPIHHPILVQLRSKDVLHDFYVPEFRVKMDAVPGLITSFWFTPTVAGSYEIACAEYCGLGHHTMRGVVVVEDEAAFLAWVDERPTFGGRGEDPPDNPIERGERIALSRGCLGCHSIDGNAGVGPTWLGLYGRQETLGDGSTVTVDDAYIRESILQPTAKLVAGYTPVMPPYDMNQGELNALIAYIQSLQE